MKTKYVVSIIEPMRKRLTTKKPKLMDAIVVSIRKKKD